MLTRFKLAGRGSKTEDGQILIIFAFAFIAIIMMLALLFDGAQALVLRRQMQDASDAAALAGANLIQGLNPPGCSATIGYPPGAPQAAIVAAAKASVAANLPNYPPANVAVTCPQDAIWTDGQGHTPAVQVQLFEHAPTFFGSIFGTGPLNVATRGAAVNGQNAGNQYSVILLDNSNLSWQNSRQGCPSFLLSGGPIVNFDSSIYIDSACARTNGGALSTNGNSATLTLGSNGPLIRMVGEYAPGALTITPAPVEHAAPKPDPLAKKLYQPSWWNPPYTAPLVDNRPPGHLDTPVAFTSASSLYVRKTAKYTIGPGSSSQTVVLHPGVYKGGIVLNNSSVALMEPGIYVLQGGGLQLKAQSGFYAVDYGVTTTPANWANSCHKGSCGVMIYNTGDQSGSLAMDAISVGAGTTFKVRSYDSTAYSPTSVLNDGTTHFSSTNYDHMLLWQSADPRDLSNWGQPDIHLNGGGNVVMVGTVYAPQAKVLMGGGSGGSGGDLTLQFIVWDLELDGNSNFHFVYDGREFATPLDYGLME